MKRFRERSQFFVPYLFRTPAAAAAAALFFLLSLVTPPCAAAQEEITAALLTRDLGDPRAPGNLKLVLILPDSLARHTAAARADDFRIYVFPAGLGADGGTEERYRAGGLYLWRRDDKLFLDARVLPLQDQEGPALVRVQFAPDGEVLAEGLAEGSSRYADDLVDVMLAVDISRSMLYNDPEKRRVTAARTFMEMAELGGGIGRVGLVTFNHRASVTTPLLPLERSEQLLSALSRIGAEGMTNLDTPLQLSMRELAGADSRRPVIILMTDGKNEGSVYRNTHLACAEAGVRIFTVGLTEQADHELLMEMAEASGGMYFRAPADSDLPEIYARLAAELGKRRLLDARILRQEEGSVSVPVDAGVRRLAAMADGGARIGMNGPGGARLFAGDAMTGVHLGRPVPGEWTVRWENAAPDISLLALFGETPLFLDIFPPQLRGDKLAVGVTLAEGSRPLPGARVWLEPLPGLFDDPVELHDDGLHGDGEAGDGVYGTVIDYYGGPDQFDLIVRAAGTAWEGDAFVRQSLGMVIRTPGPPMDESVSLGGAVDFGVLFPGEKGSAAADVILEAPASRELFFDLVWDRGADDWPDFLARAEIDPGSHTYALEIAVPQTAGPGEYTGRFSVSDGRYLGSTAASRVKVGTVRFSGPETADVGTVPPGTFTSRTVSLDYEADKDAPASASAGPGQEGALTAESRLPLLPAGSGSLPVEITVSVPIGTPEGEYAGTVQVLAGPGRAEIPVRWQVRAYSAEPVLSIAPLEGLPPAPVLLDGSGSLPRPPPAADSSTPSPVLSGPEPVRLDSPWERTAEMLRSLPERADAGVPSSIEIPSPEHGFSRPSESGSIWDAWWIYLLAALLLLLLLLLILAYILYRLGKSSLARFLLVSAIANLLMLAAFLALLGTSTAAAPRHRPVVTVNLVEEEYPPAMALSDAEHSMLASGDPSQGSQGVPAAPAEISLTQPEASGLPDERAAAHFEEYYEALETAAAPEAVSRERTAGESLARRDRSMRRSALTEPENELREMAEPPVREASSAPAAAAEERRRTAEATGDSPVWSETRSSAAPAAAVPELAAAVSPGTETIRLDPSVRRAEPRGRRRPARTLSDVQPEPRSQSADPVRERVYETDTLAEAALADAGTQEIRAALQAAGTETGGERTGSYLPEAAPAGGPETLLLAHAGSVSGPQAVPVSPNRRSGQRRPRAGTAPGGRQGGPESDSPSVLAPAQPAAVPGGAVRPAGTAPAETRFPEAGSGSAAQPQPEAGTADGRPGAAPSEGPAQLTAGESPAASAAGPQAVRYESGPRSGQTLRRLPRGTGEIPGSPAAVPGSRDSGPAAETGSPAGSGRTAGRGLGEGRFDDMQPGMGGTGGLRRSGGAVSGGGHGASRLDEAGPGGPGAVPLGPDPVSWRRTERLHGRRPAAAAASAANQHGLMLVVGDVSRLPDPAADSLFGVLAERITGGMEVVQRRVLPQDSALADCLLAVLSAEEAQRLTGTDISSLAAYLRAGGHLWLDAPAPGDVSVFMNNLAAAAGGEYGPLDPDHPLADGGTVYALRTGDAVAAAVTFQDWRSGWRYGGPKNGGTLRFLTRSLNYFLSGDADAGISLRGEMTADSVLVQPPEASMPERLAGAAAPGIPWETFGEESAAAWTMPSWSDPGRISPAGDGEGGRALRMDLRGAVKGRAALYRTMSPPADFSRAGMITAEIYYDGEGEPFASMVFTVSAGGGWQDFETEPRRLSRGWNRLSFPLRNGTFRPLSGGADAAGLPGAGRTGRVGFFVYRTGNEAAVTVFRNMMLYDE